MACYTFTLNGEDFTISNSNTSDSAGTWQDFLQTLADLKQRDPALYQEFCVAVLDHSSVVSTQKLSRQNNQEIATCIINNLQQFGIKMHALDDASWDQFCQEHNFNPAAQALVWKDEIYVRKKGFKVSDAMHETAHLIMAYMRAKDFKTYQLFLQKMRQDPNIQQILSQVKDAPGYTGLEIELVEEALVRFIESWFTENGIQTISKYNNDQMFESFSYISDILQPFIIEMFGLDPSTYTGTLDFFSCLISELPAKFGTSIFKSSGISKTGFTEEQEKIRRRVQVKAYIDALLEDGRLEKTECPI